MEAKSEIETVFPSTRRNNIKPIPIFVLLVLLLAVKCALRDEKLSGKI